MSEVLQGIENGSQSFVANMEHSYQQRENQ